MEGEGYIKENLISEKWKKKVFSQHRAFDFQHQSPLTGLKVFLEFEKNLRNIILFYATLLSTEVSLLIGNCSSLEKIFASDYCPFKEH